MTFQKVFSEVMGRGIFAVDGDEWQDHRKVASHLFSANGLKNKMESSFINHGKIFVEMVKEHIPEDKIVNFQELMQGFTFSSICDIAFGVNTYALEEGIKGNKIDFLVQFDRIQQMSVLRFILPRMVTSVMQYLNIGSEKLIREDAKEIRKYVNKIVRDRKENKDLEQKEDLLSLYIKTARATGKRYIEEDAYLEDAILNFMIAGRDTTSCSLTNLFNFLSKNPSCEEKLFEEFNRVVGKGNFVTFETMRNLPFGRAVFNETIRMMPPGREKKKKTEKKRKEKKKKNN
jgi:cytochrome P450